VYYWGQVEKTSFTESEVDVKHFQVHMEGYFRVFRSPRISVDFWGGFRYQRIEQDIIGYDGWQLWRDVSKPEVVPIHGTDTALFYRVTYTAPHIGLRSNLHPDSRSLLSVWAAFAPVWVSDFDDHLLRKKTGISNITGSGGLFGAQIQVQPAHGVGMVPIVSVRGDLAYFRASGRQTQHWYGDDPITPDYDDTGSTLAGLPHVIETLQISLGLRVALVF